MLVLVIDNYDSFVYNLVQLVGGLGATPRVFRNDKISVREAHSLEPDAVILSPGPGHPADPRRMGVCGELLREVSRTTPTLGVCFGHQAIVQVFGGKVARANRIMHGKTSQIRHDSGSIFSGVKNPLTATRYHSLVADPDYVPDELEVSATSMDDGEIMGVRHRKYPIEGVQFHPESILTNEGPKIVRNFLRLVRK